MVVVTHEMGFARRAANPGGMFMADGAIIEDAPPNEFFDNPSRAAPRTSGKVLNH